MGTVRVRMREPVSELMVLTERFSHEIIFGCGYCQLMSSVVTNYKYSTVCTDIVDRLK